MHPIGRPLEHLGGALRGALKDLINPYNLDSYSGKIFETLEEFGKQTALVLEG